MPGGIRAATGTPAVIEGDPPEEEIMIRLLRCLLRQCRCFALPSVLL